MKNIYSRRWYLVCNVRSYMRERTHENSKSNMLGSDKKDQVGLPVLKTNVRCEEQGKDWKTCKMRRVLGYLTIKTQHG